jgi:hypothetical protein
MFDESDLHRDKHFDPRISTFFGITIDWSDESWNTSNPIRVKNEFNSNKMNSSFQRAFKSHRLSPSSLSHLPQQRFWHFGETEQPVLWCDPGACEMKAKRPEPIRNIHLLMRRKSQKTMLILVVFKLPSMSDFHSNFDGLKFHPLARFIQAPQSLSLLGSETWFSHSAS